MRRMPLNTGLAGPIEGGGQPERYPEGMGLKPVGRGGSFLTPVGRSTALLHWV